MNLMTHVINKIYLKNNDNCIGLIILLAKFNLNNLV
jgi:hypothetical protein